MVDYWILELKHFTDDHTSRAVFEVTQKQLEDAVLREHEVIENMATELYLKLRDGKLK